MKIPAYLKTKQESGAVFIGSVELNPHEFEFEYVDRVVMLDGGVSDYSVQLGVESKRPIQQVRLQLDIGPFGVPYATHTVDADDYVNAQKFWVLFAVGQK